MRKFMNSTTAKIAAAASIVASVTMAAVASGADAISSGFTTIQTTLVGYLGDAVVLVLALLGLSVGIRFLVKWAKHAART